MKKIFKQAAEDAWYGMMLPPAREQDKSDKVGANIVLGMGGSMIVAGAVMGIPLVVLLGAVAMVPSLDHFREKGAAVRRRLDNGPKNDA